MQYLFLLLLALPSFAAGHFHAGPSDHPATHGMALVGREKFYVSHLPMFHAPHDYQVILEVQLDAAASGAYRESLRQSPGLYTIVPEKFVLPEMAAEGKSFRADIYFGHFERGGQKIIEQAAVTVSRVVYFAKFVPGAVKAPEANYLLFGKDTEQFLAHEIVAAPDFDQILKVNASSNAGKITVQNHPGQLPLNAPKAYSGQTVDGRPLSFHTEKVIYFETGDLSE